MLPKTKSKLKLVLWMGAVVAAMAVASPAVAQNGNIGCKNSPENPTALLALVGSAGGVLVAVRSRLRSRLRGRK